MELRRIALGLAVAALVIVGAVGVVAAVVEQSAPPPGAARQEVPVVRPSSAAAAAQEEGWTRVTAGGAAYAVPPAWTVQPAEQQVAYREAGVVIASGRGHAVTSVDGCPVAWAVLADPVRSANTAGVAKATALAWARGYAGLPARSLPVVVVDGVRARVEVPLEGAVGCAGERAELTAVARPVGDAVVALVVARYLDVRGAPSDTAYARMLGSLTVD